MKGASSLIYFCAGIFEGQIFRNNIKGFVIMHHDSEFSYDNKTPCSQAGGEIIALACRLTHQREREWGEVVLARNRGSEQLRRRFGFCGVMGFEASQGIKNPPSPKLETTGESFCGYPQGCKIALLAYIPAFQRYNFHSEKHKQI